MCLSFLDIILNFALLLLVNGLFKCDPGNQGASVEGENNTSKHLGKLQFFFCSKNYSHTLSEKAKSAEKTD